MKTLESYLREAAEEEVSPGKMAPSPHEGFVIQELEMKGFMRYLDRTSPPITFPQKFTAITGPTGAGKTTILDAITFALYKRSTRTDIQGIKISEICRNGGYVRLAFHQGGLTHVVKRGFTTAGSPYLEVTRDSKPLRGTIPELESTTQDIIGLDYEGFRNSTFVRQEEMKQLGADRPSERLEVFQKLFRLETFEKAADIAKERLDLLRGEIQEAEGELHVLVEQLAQLTGLEEEVEAGKDRVKGAKMSLDQTEELLVERQEALAALEKDHEAYLRRQASLEALNRGVEELDRRLREKREILRRLPDLKEKSERLSEEVKELSRLQEEAQELMDRQQRATLLQKEFASVEDRLKDAETSLQSLVTDLEKKVREEEERLDDLSTDIGVEEAFELLRRDGTLEERVARIDKELEWLSQQADLVDRLRREQEESLEELARTRDRVQGINRDTFLYSEIKDRLEELKEALERRRREWQAKEKALQQKRQELKEKLDEVHYGPDERKRLMALRETLGTLGEKEELLQQAREELQRLEDLEELIQEMEEENEEKRARRDEVARSLAEAEEQETTYLEARKEVEALREQRDEAAKALYQVEADLKTAVERLEDLRQMKKKQATVEERLEGLRSRAEVHTILREGVFHKRGVVMYAVNRLLPELEIETSKNLNELTNGRLQRVRLETSEEARGYGIRILVEGVDGEWHDVGIFSGGERTQINAALRFAIAKELASMPQVGRTYGRMKTLFIDEGDLGSLDTEGSRELFVAKLFRMGDAFEKVILITHLAEVAEKFPGRIRVTMTPQGQSRTAVMA